MMTKYFRMNRSAFWIVAFVSGLLILLVYSISLRFRYWKNVKHEFIDIALNDLSKQIRINQLFFSIGTIEASGLLNIPSIDSTSVGALLSKESIVVDMDANKIRMVLDNGFETTKSIVGQSVSSWSRRANVLFYEGDLSEIENIEVGNFLQLGDKFLTLSSVDTAGDLLRIASKVRRDFYYSNNVICDSFPVLRLVGDSPPKRNYIRFDIDKSELTICADPNFDYDFYKDLLDGLELQFPIVASSFGDVKTIIIGLQLPNPEVLIYCE